MPRMDIPDDIKIKATVKGGAVYYFVEESFVGSGSHYFVVLNKNPIVDDGLVFVCAVTLDIDVIERITPMNYGIETLVQATSVDYPLLKHPTLFNCNNIIVQPVEVLVNKLQARALSLKDPVPDGLLNKLRKGVLASKHVSEKVKRLLR